MKIVLKKWIDRLLDLILWAAGLVALWIAAQVFLFASFRIPSDSMEPTLEKDSFILGSRIYGKLSTGDIVIFEHEGQLMVKRIAAVQGEEIERNGIQITVPANCYYMLGDNSANSYDSRFWTKPFIEKGCIVAKLLW